jgi:hypothetical protein
VSAQLHFNIYKEIGIKLDYEHWYEHVPKSVETIQEGKIAVLWNQQLQTDKTIANEEPDILIREDERGTCMLVDVPISGDRNAIKKGAEKIVNVTVPSQLFTQAFAMKWREANYLCGGNTKKKPLDLCICI